MEVVFDITDPKDMEWLDSMATDEQRIQTIQRCITIGRMVFQSTHLQFVQSDPYTEKIQPVVDSIVAHMNDTVNELTQSTSSFDRAVAQNTAAVMETLRSTTGIAQQIVQPLTEKMSLIDNNIHRLLAINSSSNVKGKITEGIFGNMMERLFPTWEIENMSNQAHESDYHIHTEWGRVLVELKNYNHTVNTAQVQKFYRDIEETGVRFAVFLSIQSGIVGRSGLSWEWHKSGQSTDDDSQHDDSCLIVWLPNSGMEPIVIQTVFALMNTLRSVYLTKDESTRSERRFTKEEVDGIIEEIKSVIETGYSLQSNLAGMIQAIRTNLHEHRATMDRQIMDLSTRLTELEVLYRSAVSDTFQSINNCLCAIPGKQGGGYRIPIPFEGQSDWNLWVKNLPTNAQNKKQLELLYNEIQGWRGFHFGKPDRETDPVQLLCTKDAHTKRIAEMIIAKTKVDLVLPYRVESDSFCIYHQYETYRDGAIQFGIRGGMDGIETLKRRLETLLN